MPGTTEPVHLFEGVAVGNRGAFWYVAGNTTNTVVTVTSESIDIMIEPNEVEIYVEAS